MKLLILILIIILALDSVFRDGFLLSEFISQDLHLPFLVRIFLFVIALVATILLFHSIIWEYNLLPKPKNKKTQFEVEKELEEEKIKQEEKNTKNFNKSKQTKKDDMNEPIKKKSKLG